jgi:hypothetical protein
MMQLGCGLLQDVDWADIIVRSQETVNISDPTDWQGSHGCGNGCRAGGLSDNSGVCVNVFCMFWESRLTDSNRKICHRRFAVMATGDRLPDLDDMECICLSGTMLACIPGRSHQKHQDIHDGFFEHFNAIRFEVVDGSAQRGSVDARSVGRGSSQHGSLGRSLIILAMRTSTS